MFFRFFISRIIKILANLIKLACYVFHLFFPNKRFTIPKNSPAIYRKNNQCVIPNILWQTNYTDSVTLPVYLNYLFNRLMSPTYEYRFMTPQDIESFIKSNYSATIYNSYLKLQIGAAQADFWRLLVLEKYGGVYLDIDAHFVWPLNFIIKPHYTELFLLNKKKMFSNWFIASKNNSVHLKKMIDIILTNIEENKIKNIYYLTGPGVITQSLNNVKVNAISYRWICGHGNFTNEFFQYIDKPQGKWTRAQEKIDIIKK